MDIQVNNGLHEHNPQSHKNTCHCLTSFKKYILHQKTIPLVHVILIHHSFMCVT